MGVVLPFRLPPPPPCWYRPVLVHCVRLLARLNNVAFALHPCYMLPSILNTVFHTSVDPEDQRNHKCITRKAVPHGHDIYLFAIYIDSLVEKVQACGYGCYLRRTCISIILYVDDVLLLAPSVSSLQLILSVCEKELHRLDMMINVKKSHSVCALGHNANWNAAILLRAILIIYRGQIPSDTME